MIFAIRESKTDSPYFNESIELYSTSQPGVTLNYGYLPTTINLTAMHFAQKTGCEYTKQAHGIVLYMTWLQNGKSGSMTGNSTIA